MFGEYEMTEKRLSELVGGNGRLAGVTINGLALDSRVVGPGFLFAALDGVNHDGRAFIPDALNRGAVAVLSTPDTATEMGAAALITDDNPRKRIAEIAAAFYGPGPDTVAAVTGTNGKTSVACFARQIWARLGTRAASVGTLGVQYDEESEETGLTTPDCLRLHQILSDLADKGVCAAIIEASSHGLEQFRLDGLNVAVAAFTNLTRDHLDYHADFDTYFAAKQRLFTDLLPNTGSAVINTDSETGRRLADMTRARGVATITVGHEDQDIAIVSVRPEVYGQAVEIAYKGQIHALELRLYGAFQVENAALAAGIVLTGGASPDAVFEALEGLSEVPGRLELVGTTPSGGALYIDYAHTPDGLQNAIEAARAHASGKVHVVFGCGGERDRGKRPMMGEIAVTLADRVYVTDDNPRGEDAALIRAEILAAAPGASEFDSRSSAIEVATANLANGDILLITGKGHEQGQIIGDRVVPYSDHQVAAAAISALVEREKND